MIGVNAGTDMFMEPSSAEQFEDLLLAEASAGRVSQARIDDAVSRILRKKLELGLFEQPYAAGRNADNIGNQAGGWTIQWQGVSTRKRC
jgi:beta-glucosidase